jgi:hypothetical protein
METAQRLCKRALERIRRDIKSGLLLC